MKAVITSKIQESLRTAVADNPGNISAACQMIAKKFKVKQGTVASYYYKNLRKGPALFITHASNGKVFINTKHSASTVVNSRRFQLKKEPISLSQLDTQSKAELFDIIMSL